MSTIEITRHGGELPEPARNARAAWSRRDGLFVRLVGDDGVCGLGEASPLPGWSVDGLERCAAELAAVRVEALPADVTTPAAAAAALDAAGVTAPAARFALETALLDAAARRRGLPLWRLLAPDASGAPVPLAALATDLPGARAALARGVRTLKVKAGAATWARDLGFLRALRAELGDDVALRVDLNGSLEPGDTAVRLAELAPLAPELVEEPGLAGPPAVSPVPLAADESLLRPGAWPALAPRVAALVLKPTLLGGLHACLALARDAEARGVATLVTHTFDGPVALAAACHLALALPGRVLACGLAPHGGLSVWPAWRVAALGEARVEPTTVPGIGLGGVP
jgi:L-alanine-DL-glutamate epimerase-like enolase superfamily enzyme